MSNSEKAKMIKELWEEYMLYRDHIHGIPPQTPPQLQTIMTGFLKFIAEGTDEVQE